MDELDEENVTRSDAAGRVPLDEALGIARQIAEALQAAHDQGSFTAI